MIRAGALWSSLVLLSGIVAPVVAREQSSEPFPTLGRLYRNDENPVLQEFWLLGRYHGQYHWSEGSNGDDQGWENRRLRAGFQARMFDKLTVHAQAVSGTDLDPVYNGFTELWAGWKFSDALTLTVGQQKHRFTHDRNVSSRYINYLERGMLTNMFALDYTPAVTLSGTVDKDWTYYTGVFSNATSRHIGRAFTNLDSGYSFLASVTRDLHGAGGMDSTHLNVAYLHSDAKGDATNLTRFDHGINTALIMTRNGHSLVTELTAGLGGTNQGAVGLNVQPTWFVTRKVQLVGRYQIAVSDSPNGLSSQRRYERPAGLGSGDFYQAGYAGMDYYLAAHRVKLMAGVEYARMDGRHVWTTSLAFRTFFGPHSRGPFPAGSLLEPD
jgi:phosphate-selective porin OprO/OprP